MLRRHIEIYNKKRTQLVHLFKILCTHIFLSPIESPRYFHAISSVIFMFLPLNIFISILCRFSFLDKRLIAITTAQCKYANTDTWIVLKK